MGYVSDSRETTRIELATPGYWVDVFKSLKYREQKALQAVAGDAVAAADKVLALMIADWNLDDDRGQKLDVTPENIDQLERADVEKLMTGLTPILTEDPAEKKGSSKTSSQPSTAAE